MAAAGHSAVGTSGAELFALSPRVFRDSHRYTTYGDGGFRAGVWVDVLQGATIMVFGVGVIFFLMLRQTEGLEKATRSVANMMPLEHG